MEISRIQVTRSVVETPSWWTIKVLSSRYLVSKISKRFCWSLTKDIVYFFLAGVVPDLNCFIPWVTIRWLKLIHKIGSLIYFQAMASSTYFPLNFKQWNIFPSILSNEIFSPQFPRYLWNIIFLLYLKYAERISKIWKIISHLNKIPIWYPAVDSKCDNACSTLELYKYIHNIAFYLLTGSIGIWVRLKKINALDENVT